MTRSFRLAALVLAAGLAGCMQRPPNSTTAEGQAFYACDRPALDQTAEIDDLISQVRQREDVRRGCLASGDIPPLPGARFVEAPVVLAPLAPLPPGPAAQPAPQPLTPPPAVPSSQDYQPPPIIQQ
jgi:hypothetical protein